MLYGFLGFKPTATGCGISPRLPADWPSLTITRVHLHDHVLELTAAGKEIRVVDRADGVAPLEIRAPSGWTVTSKATP